jgi:uncharacterized protein YkwD
MDRAAPWPVRPSASPPLYHPAGLIVPLLIALAVGGATVSAILSPDVPAAERSQGGQAKASPGGGLRAFHPRAADPASEEPVLTGELDLLNADRRAAGLPPLRESATLDAIASVRAAQLAQSGLSHYLPGHTASALVEQLAQAGVPYLWHGENIAWEAGLRPSDVPAFFNDWWMGSADHRANILSPNFRQLGLGLYEADGRVYMVEDFTD